MTTDHRLRWVTMLGEWVLLPPRPRVNVAVLRAFEEANRLHKLNARKCCDRIEATAPERQEFLVVTHPKAYISYPVVEELLRRVKKLVFENPVRAEELARIALLIAERLTPAQPNMRITSLCREAQARAHANLGNVCRLLCKWSEAELHLAKAVERLRNAADAPEVIAEVQSLRGSFLKDRQQYEEAITALKVAAALYRELGDSHQAGIVLLKLASTYRLMREPALALPIHLQGTMLVDEDRQPVAAAAAWNNLVRIYLDMGRFEDADSTLRSAPDFTDLCPPTSSIHCDRVWTEGCVHHGLGRLAKALECFQKADEGFRVRNELYNAALVQLDRLRVLTRQGNLAEVERSARGVYELLKSQPLAREAAEALGTLCRLGTQRRLAEAIIEEAIVTLRRCSPPSRSS